MALSHLNQGCLRASIGDGLPFGSLSNMLERSCRHGIETSFVNWRRVLLVLHYEFRKSFSSGEFPEKSGRLVMSLKNTAPRLKMSAL